MGVQRPKIALIGAGAIGGNMAVECHIRHLGDVILFDVSSGMPSGKALDMKEAEPILGTSGSFLGTSNYADIAGADVVIVTAGLTKAPGATDDATWNRDQLLPFNAAIMRKVGAGIKEFCPSAFVICITNPLDCMVKVLQQASCVPTTHICGMAGALDSSRFRTFIAEALEIAPKDVQGLVLGAHGDAMVPLPRFSSINGIPLNNFVENGTITQKKVDEIVERTKYGGLEIVKLLGQGSAFYAPAVAAVDMAEAYLRDQKRVIPCAAYVEGKYGANQIYIGVPAVIGGEGIHKIIELDLNAEEKVAFQASIKAVERLEEKLITMEQASG